MTARLKMFGKRMRLIEAALILFVLFTAVFAVGTTSAYGHMYYGGHVGVYIGPGWWWGYPYYAYPYPYYYPYPYAYPPAVSEPAVPETYIERSEPESRSSSQTGTWYYCPESKTYYPYVKECPGGWREVPAQPAPGPGR